MRFRFHWIPLVFVLAFGVVFVANGTMVYFALSTWTGVAVDQPYQRGIEYNRVLAAQAKQDDLGWSFDLTWSATGAGRGQGEVRLRATDRAGRPLTGLDIEGAGIRPVEKPAPVPMNFRGVSEGVYAASVEFGAPGNWDVRIKARTGRDVAIVTKRIFVR